MKCFIAIALLSFSLTSVACESTTTLMDTDPAVTNLLKKQFGENIKIESDGSGLKTLWLKAYPTLMDRLAMSSLGGMRGTSCEIEGPNGERLMHGAKKIKSDYRFFLTNEEGAICTADIRLVATETKVKAKLLSTICL